MPDPNEILGQIQMKCADVAKSKTALGYDLNVMASLGMIVFGNAAAVRDAIQAPDGQPWRHAMFDEAAKRILLDEEIERLRATLLNIQAKAGKRLPVRPRLARKAMRTWAGAQSWAILGRQKCRSVELKTPRE